MCLPGFTPNIFVYNKIGRKTVLIIMKVEKTVVRAKFTILPAIKPNTLISPQAPIIPH